MGQQPSDEIEETIKFLLELVTDLDVDFGTDQRIQAASRAAALGSTDAAVAALVELTESMAGDPYTGAARLEIAREVAKLGDAESCVGILAAICEDDDLEWEERNEAAQEISGMGDTVAGVSGINAVLYFANEGGVDMGFDAGERRILAAERMAKAGQTEDAVEVLKVITEKGVWPEDDKYNRMDRWNAACTLSAVGDSAAAAKAFLSLAVDDDPDAEDQERLEAALKVAELGDWEMASEALASIAEECDREEVRLKAAVELASVMDEGAERAIEIIGLLLSQRYSNHQLKEAQMERDLAVNDQTPSLPRAATMTDQEKAWALILEATKILYPGAFTNN